MQVPSHSVMEKQISVKCFNAFQCLKFLVKSHMLRMLEPSKLGQKSCQRPLVEIREPGTGVFGWLIRIIMTRMGGGSPNKT